MNEQDVKIGLRVKVIGCGMRGKVNHNCITCSTECIVRNFVGKIIEYSLLHHLYKLRSDDNRIVEKYASSFVLAGSSYSRIERMIST